MTANGTATSKLFEREPPHSAESEMALLGAMLLDFSIVPEVQEVVKAEDFYSEHHAAIFDAITSVADKSAEAALLGVFEQLKRSGIIERIGPDYLTKLCEQTPGPAASNYFAKTITEHARVRKLIAAGSNIIRRAMESNAPASDQVDMAEAEVFAITDLGPEHSQAEPLAAILDREMERISLGKGMAGLATHYPDLDRLTGGFQPGDMIVIAARPSMGKSALMLNIAEQMANGGVPSQHGRGVKRRVGIFTLEMSRASVGQRLLSAYSGVSCSAMRTGGMSATSMKALEDATISMSGEVYIDDTSALTVGALRSRARRMKARYGIEILFVDYLQLMTAPGPSKESRQVEVSAISRGVKALARELNIPVVCLSQLNRGTEGRQGNRPRLSDLRESGAIEQDADVVMLLHREDYYRMGQKNESGTVEPPDNKAELIIAKQRNGPTDIVELVWSPVATRFQSAAMGAWQ